MQTLVEERLTALGCELTESDSTIISFIVTEVTNDWYISTNTNTVPDEMKPILANRVCGKFLLSKRSIGQLDIETLDFEVVKSVSMGDTSVTMGGTSNADLFDAYVNYLLNDGKGKVGCYRRLKW